MTTAEIIALEDRYQVPTYAKLPIALVRGEGAYVWDADGNRYLDFYGGHCVTVLGHSPPHVVRAISEQASQLMFYSNVVYSDVRARAAEALATMSPEGLQTVFFCNSGTEANETALKLARKVTGRSAVVAMEGGFHGRTLGSLAVTYGQHYREPYSKVLPETLFIPFGDLEAAERATSESNVAALILEPIQSMAGVVEASEGYYRGLRELCDARGVVLVFDEVQTGVGRTGTFSVSQQYGMRPDLITLAKSLGSGLPVGAVLVSDDIARSVRPGDQGTTFGGGMMAMAAVKATLEAIRDIGLMEWAQKVFLQISSGVEGSVKQVRGRGCLIGIELDGPARPVLAGLREKGVLAGGADAPNVIRLMPPLNTGEEEITYFVDALHSVMGDQ